MSRTWLSVWTCAGWLAAGAAGAQPALTTSYLGFGDVNGNGALDCGEPVTIVATFATRNSGTPALSGSLSEPAAGSAGLSFLPGSVAIDPDLTVGCQGTIVQGNSPEDLAARVDFSCPADPVDNNAWTLVVRYQAIYDNASARQFTATAHAATSDGQVYDAATTSTAPAEVCGGAPNQVAVAKTAAGPGTPGSVLLYSITVTDTSGLGDGGVQLVETVPAHTSFDAGGSSTEWFCTPGPGAGSVCRNAVGNVPPNGTLQSFFAVTIEAPLAAADRRGRCVPSFSD